MIVTLSLLSFTFTMLLASRIPDMWDIYNWPVILGMFLIQFFLFVTAIKHDDEQTHLENKLAETQKEVENLQNQVAEAKNDRDDEKHRADQYQKLYENNSSPELEAIKGKLLNAEAEAKHQRERCATLEKDYTDLSFDFETLKKENADLRKQLKTSSSSETPHIMEFEKYKIKENVFYRQTLQNLQSVFYQDYDISKLLDAVVDGRLNNAFGSELSFVNVNVESYIQSIHDNGTQKTYRVTLNECNCGSFKQPCKHRVFLAYSLGILQVNREDCRLHYDKSVERITKNAPLPKKEKAAAKAAETINKL